MHNNMNHRGVHGWTWLWTASVYVFMYIHACVRIYFLPFIIDYLEGLRFEIWPSETFSAFMCPCVFALKISLPHPLGELQMQPAMLTLGMANGFHKAQASALTDQSAGDRGLENTS